MILLRSINHWLDRCNGLYQLDDGISKPQVWRYLASEQNEYLKIRFCTDKPPDYSDILDIPDYHYWRDTAYGKHEEELPINAPSPIGKRVVITHYYDASFMHDVLSGKAVTGILHFYNKTLIDSYSKTKKQATTKTATYRSEFESCRTCVNHMIDHRN